MNDTFYRQPPELVRWWRCVIARWLFIVAWLDPATYHSLAGLLTPTQRSTKALVFPVAFSPHGQVVPRIFGMRQEHYSFARRMFSLS